MAITPYLSGPYYFDLETKRVLGLALELACISLCTGDWDDKLKHAIADKLIALAKTGERNPNVLCVKALEAICRPPEHDKPSADHLLPAPITKERVSARSGRSPYP